MVGSPDQIRRLTEGLIPISAVLLREDLRRVDVDELCGAKQIY